MWVVDVVVDRVTASEDNREGGARAHLGTSINEADVFPMIHSRSTSVDATKNDCPDRDRVVDAQHASLTC